ncbi:histidine kinase [Dyadobacter sp. 32]|uniref:sensor histidine kinase n=1 Tax=Dyadobacter sp. 32 TaxID=538966 RepID=UPI0011EF2898
MSERRKWYLSVYVQEAGFFVAMFILTMLHEWIEVDTVIGFLKGLAFFLILYLQAQLHRFFILPLMLKKQYDIYTVVSILTTSAGALLLYAANYFWLAPAYYFEDGFVISFTYHFVICTISTITIMSFSLARQYSIAVQNRYHDQLLLSEMNIKFLHAQLNPHFFFNMFNNLYGVSLTEPARVPALILQLSGLMRYQLENGTKPTVSIQQEIEFVHNYIVMEKERVGNRCAISFNCPTESSLLSSYQIAPLILITLVENAFKHSLTVTTTWFINITIEVKDHRLILDIQNSLPDLSFKRDSTGIGLKNIKQRLELLYNGQYSFRTAASEDSYRTTLILQLKNF